jgi:hypothetical protein
VLVGIRLPHSGQRLKLARTSYPHFMHRPASRRERLSFLWYPPRTVNSPTTSPTKNAIPNGIRGLRQNGHIEKINPIVAVMRAMATQPSSHGRIGRSSLI